jgi:hypothetical protein
MIESKTATRTMTYQVDQNTHLSTGIVLAVSTLTDTAPTELTERLYDAVDPDALDRLCAGDGAGDVTTSFEFSGCRVRVESGQDVHVTELSNGR